MNPISQADLRSIHVLDGGMATELERHGCDLSGPLWSAHILDSSPGLIERVHLDYLRAGADCISTASYQVSNLGYAEFNRTEADAAHALRQSVEIAIAARDEYCRESTRPTFIAASLGPYGAALHNGAEFHGRYTISFDDLVRFHAERLAVVAETEADLVALETVPSVEEARAIAQALQLFPPVAAWVSFTCKDERSVAHGEPLAECAALLESSAQVVAIAVNCTQPKFISSLIGEIQSASSKPVFVYPNSGELWNTDNRSWYGSADIAGYASLATDWYAARAQAVGGCCRTTPAHIRAVRQTCEERRAAASR
ncbi:homocysteine S-methyltransferase [Silvibacterium bohemicum]|uniref:S-methylmethionine:homocysteine methyltransferase n=1 Tax=Silvibacterium bohemicum TaxID=1577686 RepID=A0A841K817_9BACT|nr:homocysteine S-methyltransferase [Silvibacterium bohemicum]MBB6146434.1 homocysteine S-methyltransferase [Silvibacterium bohemicum]